MCTPDNINTVHLSTLNLIKMKTPLTSALLVCASLLSVPAAHAALAFHVDVNTAGLAGNPGAPFALDFQLIDGGGAAANTVTLSGFTFGGGNPTGSALLTGGASGSLLSSVTLTDSAFFNEFYQTFDAGSTFGFDIFTTLNEEAGIPDGFSFSILDKDLVNIPTSGLGDSLVFFSITEGLTVSGVESGSGTGAYADVTTTVVPEASVNGVSLIAVLGICGLANRRLRRAK